MTDKGKPKLSDLKPSRVTLVQCIIIIIILAIGLGAILFGASGTFPSVVAVESGSMEPNLNVGDLVFIVQKDRLGEIVTSNEAQERNETSFGGYGDIIVYNPNGNTHTTAIIHRVVGWINETEARDNYGFPYDVNAGYITKGDNNKVEDQTLAFNGIGRVYPIKDEWIVGKAVISIPLLGYIPMYIWQIAVVILIILLVYEWFSRRADKIEKAEEEQRLREEEKNK
ncbi:MAG: signal peptidase I [Methanocorpusculum sp.]|nr:signal peptidase I [Methanocorpusculum sp.]